MESCSGGLLSATISDEPGSRVRFKGGLATCSSEARVAGGVNPATISRYGPGSAEVAGEMARAARHKLAADIGLAVNGDDSPDTIEARQVAVVYIAINSSSGTRLIKASYPANRSQVRRRAVTAALFELRKMLNESR